MSENPRTQITPPAEVGTRLDDPSLYINRELSWLEFNRRVFEEALTRRAAPGTAQVPGHFRANLDEFFMVRVGGLQQKVPAGIPVGAGRTACRRREQVDRISRPVQELTLGSITACSNKFCPPWRRKAFFFRGRQELTDERRHISKSFFASRFSRCSRRWPSIRAIRSRTFSTSRSTWPFCCNVPRARRSCSPWCRCRPCCRVSCRSHPKRGPSSPRWRRSFACTWTSCFRACSWIGPSSFASPATANMRSMTMKWRICSRRLRKRSANAGTASRSVWRSRPTLRLRSATS